MSRLNNYFPVFQHTFVPAGTINAGQPIGYDGNVAAADAQCLGVCMEDAQLLDPTATMIFGFVEVTGGGVINVGDPIKVGTGGKFLASDMASVGNIAKNVGRAVTACAADGSTFMAVIGLTR